MTRLSVILLFILFTIIGMVFFTGTNVGPCEGPAGRVCRMSLQLISEAKAVIASTEGLKNGDVIDPQDIFSRIQSHAIPGCRTEGIYKIGRVGEQPSCSVHGSMSRIMQFENNAPAMQLERE